MGAEIANLKREWGSEGPWWPPDTGGSQWADGVVDEVEMRGCAGDGLHCMILRLDCLQDQIPHGGGLLSL